MEFYCFLIVLIIMLFCMGLNDLITYTRTYHSGGYTWKKSFKMAWNDFKMWLMG